MSVRRADVASEVAAEWAGRRASVAALSDLRERSSLILGDPGARLARALEAAGRRVARWNRFLVPGQLCSPWPPPGPFEEVWVRMPRSTPEAAMLLHAAALRVPDGGSVHLYGANDEGIRSATRHFPVGTEGDRSPAFNKRRCRVLSGTRSGAPPRPDGLDRWESTETVDWGTGKRRWVFYPGVFAHGRLDPATALLVEALARVPVRGRVVDFGTGAGFLGAAALERAEPGTEAFLLDRDAIALEAARRNVPGATLVLGDELGAVAGRFDLVVSNPPIHVGGRESLRALRALTRDSAASLARRGRLLAVAQRRLPLAAMLEQAFADVVPLADRGPFRAWSASRARRRGRGDRPRSSHAGDRALRRPARRRDYPYRPSM